MRQSARTLGCGVSRRWALGLLLGLAAAPATAAADPAAAYMEKVGKDLLNANRQGTAASFLRAIQRHADVAEIALYSLGQYKTKLPASMKEKYFRGVALFMSRYFADQSREYRVAKYTLGDSRKTDDGDFMVDSRIYMLSGRSYTVVWRVGKRGGKFRVLDAKVLGFSLVYLQRGLFTSYISKRKGDVSQLVAVLNG